MEQVSLIVGLGNPGAEYERTRHNAGFMLVERLAAAWRLAWRARPSLQVRLATGRPEGRRCLLCQPQTFMNASGQAVAAVVDYYRVPLGQVLILVDDADLALGQLRLRARGGSGGHHGLESVEQHLGSRDYARLRLGIGRRVSAARELVGHVLGRFNAEDGEQFEPALEHAAAAVMCWLTDGVAAAMNQFNSALPAPEPKAN